MPVIQRVGLAVASLSDGLPLGGMCGYAIQSRRATARPPKGSPEELRASALAVEVDGGEQYVLLFVDLWAPSAGLLAAVAHAVELPVGNILLAATHTHTGPANYFNNRLWDAAPARLVHSAGVARAVSTHLIQRCAEAVKLARTALRPGTLTVTQDELWKVGANRSRIPFDHTGSMAEWAKVLGRDIPSEFGELHARVDPRLTALVAHHHLPGGVPQLAGVFAIFACHATALGQAHDRYDGDWPSRAAYKAGKALGVPVAFAQGAAGDVSPLPATGGMLSPASDETQGPVHAEDVAARVAQKTIVLARGAAPQADQRWRWEHQAWSVVQSGLPPHRLGAVALGGAEDFHSFAYGDLGTVEGNPVGSIPYSHPRQKPKWGSVDPLLALVLDMLRGKDGPKAIPLRRFAVGPHRLFSCPGEPTGWALAELAAAVQPPADPEGLTVGIGYSGEYIGYVTTADEYQMQHYEGAMTVLGVDTCAALATALAAPWPAAPESYDPILAADAVGLALERAVLDLSALRARRPL